MVVAAGGVGSAGVVGKRPGRVLLNRIIDHPGIGEHDLEAGFLQPFLDGEAHSAGDDSITVANGVDQIMVATAMPRVRVAAMCAGADVADFPLDLDSVFYLDDDEGFGTAEVSGDRVSVQGGKCDLHAVQDTVDPGHTRRPIPRASQAPMA